MQLFTKYAVTSFDDILGQDKAVTMLKRVQERTGFAGRAYWITGAFGTGKTSIANIIANDIADDWCIEEMDGTGITGAKIIDMARSLSMRGMCKPGRAVIVNEAHGLRKDAIRQLLITLEPVQSHVAWIFTTSNIGNATLFDDCDDASPLVSRCLKVELTNQGLCKLFAEKAQKIAKAEGLGDIPIAKFEALAKKEKNNFRAMLSAIELGSIAA